MKRIGLLVSRGLCACVLGLGVAACATAPAMPAPTAPPNAAPGAPPPAEPSFELSDGALVGEWAEFWALAGGAATVTQRYTFWPDGRFEWQAPPGAAADSIQRRFGTWDLVHDRLILHVTGQELRAACDDQTRPCQSTTEALSSEEQLELGPCPANDEAHALDASYRCVSIRGRAFWRRGSPVTGGPA